MICPKCGVDSFRVKKTVPYYDSTGFHCIVIRHRNCFSCGYEQKTPEMIEREVKDQKTQVAAEC
jgi:transcriptional regulator NrdR family protein